MTQPLPTAGVILAAGRASRMGTPKALLHIGGRTVLDALITAYVQAKLDPIVVVASGPTLEAALDDERATAVAGDPQVSMIESLALGIEALPESAPAAIVQPVDAPFTSAALLAALLDGNRQICRVPCSGGQPGHPVYLPRSIFADVKAAPQGGLRAVLAAREVELVEWYDSRILADLDTPADLDRWRAAMTRALH